MRKIEEVAFDADLLGSFGVGEKAEPGLLKRSSRE
jgi:hypothetical protein